MSRAWLRFLAGLAFILQGADPKLAACRAEAFLKAMEAIDAQDLAGSPKTRPDR